MFRRRIGAFTLDLQGMSAGINRIIRVFDIRRISRHVVELEFCRTRLAQGGALSNNVTHKFGRLVNVCDARIGSGQRLNVVALACGVR